MKYTYNLPLGQGSESVVNAALQSGLFEACSGKASGLSEQPLYELTDETAIKPYDPFGIKLDGHILQTNIFSLPSAEYMALAASDRDFGEFGMLDLTARLLNEQLPKQEKLLQLRGIVQADKQSPRLQPSPSHQSTWIRSHTLLAGGRKTWTLVLTFETRNNILPAMQGRSPHGVDVGLTQLAGVANGRGESWVVPGVDLCYFSAADIAAHGRTERERHLLRRLRHQLVHTMAKQRYEALIETLLQQAKSVIVEDLNTKKLTELFGHRWRDAAVYDCLYSWLPQRLHEAGIPLIRPDPAYTSQMCHACYGYVHRDVRTWQTVYCAECNQYWDAHINAARVLVSLGAEAARRRLKRQLEGGRHG